MSDITHSYPWYPSDWRGSESRASMSLSERGLYRELLDHCWMEGSLPSDEITLQRISGVTRREFAAAWPRVRVEFEEGSDGRLYHRKVNAKRAEVNENKKRRADVNRQNGTKGGRPKKTQEKPTGFPGENPLGFVTKTPSPSPSSSPSSSSSSELYTVSGTEGRTPDDDGARADEPSLNPDPAAEVADGMLQWLGHVGVVTPPPTSSWCHAICRIVWEAGGDLGDLEEQLRRWAGFGPAGERIPPRIPPTPPWGWIRRVLAEDFPAFVQVRKAGGVA